MTAAVLAGLLWATPVLGQQGCALRDAMLAHLLKTYGETVHSRAISGPGALVEVTRNDEKDTWSIVVTNPGGIACLVSEGEGWQDIEPLKGETGA